VIRPVIKPGQIVAQYQITASIGAGGMGEVFRARDTRLNRDVAVKVLPKDFAADADRLRRFEQEAKTLAALNHPNILTIHALKAKRAHPLRFLPRALAALCLAAFVFTYLPRTNSRSSIAGQPTTTAVRKFELTLLPPTRKTAIAVRSTSS